MKPIPGQSSAFWRRLSGLGPLFLETVAVYLFFSLVSDDHRWWWVPIIIHTAASSLVLAMGEIRRLGLSDVHRHRLHLYGIMVCFLPVMGLAGALVLHLVCGRWLVARGLVEDFQAETEYRVIEPERSDAHMDLKDFFDEELSVQPVMDILAGHDDNLKRGAIDTLRRIATADAVGILKKCLADASPEVRYNAHTALTRLDESHNRLIKKAQDKLDAGDRQADDHSDYANRCADYAQSGLLDDDTRRHYLTMAKEAFVRARNKGLTDLGMLLTLGRLEMQLGAFDEAEGRFRKILETHPDHAKALVGLAEVYYTRGDLGGLQETYPPDQRDDNGGHRVGGRHHPAEFLGIRAKGGIAMNTPDYDVCLMLEGTYPFVSGGVSTWVHNLIRAPSRDPLLRRLHLPIRKGDPGDEIRAAGQLPAGADRLHP